MMKTVSVPWAIWYGEKEFDMTFPDTWDVTVAEMKGGPDIGDEGIRRAFAEPISAPPLREVARGRRDAAILIDDLTRPTPSYRVLPYILEELASAGLGDDDVRIVCAVAAHRPMVRPDFIKKIGLDLMERLEVINHNAYDNLEFYGNSSQGIPIWVNREFARSDLKIAAGMITPRGPIFGGGSKLLIPGAMGRQTIYANHEYCPQEVFRQHLDEVAEMVGLEYIVNPLLNMDLGIMGMVTGDPEEAYWHGVEMGKELYRTEIPEDMDVVICNAWPKDSEGTQSGMALVPLRGKPQEEIFRENASVVIASASPEGLGFHSVMGPGTLYRERHIRPEVDDRPPKHRFIFSPNMNKYDARSLYGEEAIFCKTWDRLMETLMEIHGTSARACVFPCGAIQYGGGLG
ncbi:MAG: lactate racemase domain-containing protein [Anaerolineales bacterium]